MKLDKLTLFLPSLGSLVGPRFFAGVIIVLIGSLALTGYQLRVQIKRNAEVQASADQLQKAAEKNEVVIAELRAEYELKAKLAKERAHNNNKLRSELSDAKRKLNNVSEDECIDAPVPDAVASILRSEAG
ncbi:TPA: hypothetical protein NJ322_005033 [Vibrio parahaemolyticus]|nr:hypothetical protein [Vibrio parahaemolyticus]HCG7105677.1 hypothetical protein [Vibrio parahaemolyticus]